MILSQLILVFLLAGCNGNKEASKSDSVQSPKEEIQSPPEPQPAPAPGSAIVQGMIRTIDETTNGITCTVQIEKINAYGPGTPTLGKNTAVTMEVSQSVYKKYKKELKAEKSVNLVISSANNMQLGTDKQESNSAEWSLVSVK